MHPHCGKYRRDFRICPCGYRRMVGAPYLGMGWIGDVAAMFGNPVLGNSGFDVRLDIHPPFSGDRLLEVKARTLRGAEDTLFASP